MTNIEQEFMKVFEIKPVKYILPLGEDKYWNWQDGSRMMQEAQPEMFDAVKDQLSEEDKKLVKAIYPKITDRVLLELICALADTFVGEYCIPDVDCNKLKWHILKDCIDNDEKGQLRDLVQSLFKEVEE